MKRYILSLIFIVNIVFALNAGTFTYSSRLMGTAIAPSATLSTNDDQYYGMAAGGGIGTAWHAANDNRVVNNYVHLKYTGADNKHYSADWTIQVICQVDRWNEFGTLLTPENCTLKIEHRVGAGTKYIDVSSYRNSATPGHKMLVTVLTSGITYTGSVSAMPTDVIIESIIDVDRAYDIDASEAIYIDNTPNVCVYGSGSSSNLFAQTIEFHWDYIEGAEEYDLEWLFKSSYDSDVSLDFSEATRITTSNQYYIINNAFDEGKIYYRIRAISKDFATGLKRLEGGWTESINVVNVCNIEKRNWSYNAAYAEEGKRKEVMSYFDGSTRTRQSVTLSNTENVGLVAENMYDYEGRAAVQTLPAPSKNYRSDLKFYQYFSLNANATATPYTKTDFDNDVTGLCGTASIPGMKSSSAGEGAAHYYSDNNILKTIGFNSTIANINGDGTSFPFTQTVYSIDGTVKMQSGVGNTHKVGSTHETQYLNGSAAQEKLDRLFGNEVGYAEHYREKAVIDPNGQVSVSYENLSGQVIATCLRGDAPDNLTELGSVFDDNEPYMVPAVMQHSFVNNYDPTSESYISRENFIVTDINTDYDFTYKITAQQFQALCHDTTYSCQYFLQLTVKDDCDESVTESATVITSPNTGTALNTIHHLDAQDYTLGDFEITFTVDFPKVGVYRIEKRLWLDENALNEYLVLYERGLRNIANECITPLDELEASYESEIDLTECMTCEEFATHASTFDDEGNLRAYPYTDQNDNTFVSSGEYQTFLLAECHPDIPARNCNGLLEALKEDMSPGGQYFESIIGSYNMAGCGTSGAFSPAEYFIEALIALSATISTCTSVDVIGDWTAYAGTYTCSTPAAYDNATLTSTWDPCWADYLVRYHPEYCRYLRCVELTSSYDFDADMLNTNYTLATTTLPTSTAPYLVTATTPVGKSVLDLDPYFSTIATVPASPIDAGNYTPMYNQINGCTSCSTTCFTNFGTLPAAITAGYNTNTPMWTWALIVPDAAGSTNNDIRWSNFQKLYIATKTQYVKAYGCPSLTDATYPPDNITDNTSGVAKFEFLVAGSLPVNTLHIQNLTINDPEASNTFQDAIDDISAAVAASAADPTDGFDEVPDLCVYSSSFVTATIDPVNGDPVTPFLATNSCTGQTLTMCDSYTIATPASGFNNYVFYVNIDDVPLNYPLDNTAITWINSACYFRISNTITLPSISGSTSMSDIATYLYQIESAIDGYGSAPYDFTCNVNPPLTLGANYSYTIKAPTVLGPFGNNPNVKLLIIKKDNSGTQNTYCGSQGVLTFSTAIEDCDPASAMAPNCLCLQLNQMYEYFQAASVGGTLSFYEDDGTTLIVAYETFLEYATAQLNAGYSPGTPITEANVNYWWTNCTLTEDGQQTYMQSPLELGEDYVVAETENNTTHAIPQELDCDVEEPCQQQGYDEADFYASEEYEEQIDFYLNDFKIKYKAACLHEVNLEEEFKVEYTEKEYHYTLYYYDQAGNLVRTVPPNSVRRLYPSIMYSGTVNLVHAARVNATTPLYPDHSRIAHTVADTVNLMVTNYQYNTLNQLVQQETPDGGLTNFWYNDIGQMRFSQNEKQFLNVANNELGQYSYTIYDGQARIKEVGENYQDFTIAASPVEFYKGVNDPLFPTNPGTEVTKTYYDVVIPSLGLTQEYLRKRVSSSTYEDSEDGSDLTYNSGSHYSYDVHGNVNVLVQDYPELELSNNRFKTLNYEYDLISGNVNEVAYQQGAVDQYYHRYEYDANNRITHAYTSNDNAHWQEDARYFYYLHGPLARVEIGEEKVQGLDHAYNIHGWLKSVNTNTFQAGVDPGKDAYTHASYSYMPAQLNVHKNIATDAFGYVLDYFTNDYKAIGTNSYTSNYFNIDIRGNMSLSGVPDLYNGNIKAMSTAMYKPVVASNPSPMPIMAKFFEYDQLNRIKEAQSYEITPATSTIGALTAWTTPGTSDYYETFGYDANGNILHAERNGYAAVSTDMDDLGYEYSNLRVNNQLKRVGDNIGYSGYYANDIDVQTTSPNYTYDSIGNLKSDVAEGITNIDWTVYGKIKKITKGSGLDNIEFKYDASGNRIAKIVKPKTGGTEQTQQYWTTTYYMRDAQGNTMGIYEHEISVLGGTFVQEFLKLKETNIYGSSRLGLEQQSYRDGATEGTSYDFGGYNGDGTIINDGNEALVSGTALKFDHTLGNKQYELSNHLGNVNVVISDRKLSIDLVNNTTLVATPDGLTDNYLADVLSSTDYYSFGSPMPNHWFNSDDYRYGFNGKENDNEVKGVQGSQQDYGMRIYDPRLGRFLSGDPITEYYPELSPYQFASNSPIEFVDIDGLEAGKKEPHLVGEPFRMDSDPVMDKLATAGKVTRGVIKSGLMVFGKATQFIDDVNLGGIKRTPDEQKRFQARAEANAKSLFTDLAVGYGIGKLVGVATGMFGLTLPGEVCASAAGNTIKTVFSKVSYYAKSFQNSKYTMAEAAEDLTVYRVSSTEASAGEFFTTVKPTSSTQAIKDLNLGVSGNTASYVTPVTIKKGSQFPIGKVEGGNATQIVIPKSAQNSGGNQVIYGTPEKLPAGN